MRKGLALGIILVIVGAALYLSLYYKFPQSTQLEPDINMYQKIIDEIPSNYPGDYSIVEYDWVVSSRIFRDAGGTFSKMDTWEQFKESYRQTRLFGKFIYLDKQNRVVWFVPSGSTLLIYYEY